MENIKNICTNCNKYGHTQFYCNEPITSWGIILVKVVGEKSDDIHHDINITNILNIDNLKLITEEQQQKYSLYINSIKFLIISRKHSISFIDFIRGRYKETNCTLLKGLFELMQQEEIDMIKQNNFDLLWNEIWNGINYIDKIKIEYEKSKQKFNNLKTSTPNINFYTDTIVPLYSIPECGFPKGRKKIHEKDLDCAIREFVEETGINKSDIKILNNLDPIVEDLNGTNGKKYRHIYYLAEVISDDLIFNIENNNEVSNILLLNYYDSIDVIRPYHQRKKEILKQVLDYYLFTLIK